MKKHSYRMQSITELNREQIAEAVRGERLVVGIDVAKEAPVAALMTAGDRQVHVLVKWRHPEQSEAFLTLLTQQLPWEQLEVVLEPSGTYGDPLRSWLERHGYAVYRVSPKRCHDAAEVYDGVPSLHDAKAAVILARLHLEGASERWVDAGEARRRLRAQIQTLELYEGLLERQVNRLEGQLARYWPEVSRHLELKSATLLEVLSVYGSPAQVAAQEAEARVLMRRIGGHGLAEETIEQVLASARSSLGVPCVDAERQYLQTLAQEARRVQQAAHTAQRQVERAGQSEPEVEAMAPVIGRRTAVVLFCLLGAVHQYPNAASYVKAMGLNLKERSSGKHQGRLMITKRGSGTVRRYLYWAVLRLLHREPLLQQWYQHKVARRGGSALKALVALMRKLARALWHVAQGAPFEVTKLINEQALSEARG